MLISSATLDALRTGFSIDFQRGYDVTETTWQTAATQIPSNSKSNTYGWVERIPTLRQWTGERIARNLKEQKYVLENVRYEETVEVDRDDIEDDQLGMYTNFAIPALGAATKKHPDQLLAAMITANTALAYDGLALFHDAHTIGSTTYDNKNALSLTAANFNTVWSQMVSYVGEDGQPLGVMPDTIFYAPQRRKDVLDIIQAPLTAHASLNASITNTQMGWVKGVMLQEMAASPNFWALADCSKPIKPFVFQMRRPAQFVSRDQASDPKVFDLAKYTYGVDGRWAMGITLPFLISLGNI